MGLNNFYKVNYHTQTLHAHCIQNSQYHSTEKAKRHQQKKMNYLGPLHKSDTNTAKSSVTLLNDPPKGCECFICCEWLLEAWEHVCGNIICHKCRNKIVYGSDTRCPSCREVMTEQNTFHSIYYSRRVAEALFVYCSNKNKGCTYTCCISDLNHHVEKCGFTEIICQEDDRCLARFLRKNQSDHQTICIYRKIPCTHCCIKFLWDQIDTHQETCLYKLQECSLCKEMVRGMNKKKHQEIECKFLSTKCTNEGCGETFHPSNQYIHRQKCQFKIILCKYCKESIQERNLSQHLKTECERRYCPNRSKGCMKIIYPSKNAAKKHLKHECEYQTLTCYNQNCFAKFTRPNMEAHKSTCIHRMVVCSDCNKNFTFQHLEYHQLECPETKLSCLNCKDQIPRGSMIQHLSMGCREATILCPLDCGKEFRRKEYQGHLSVCAKYSIPCPECKEIVIRSDLPQHQQTLCPKRLAPCLFNCGKLLPFDQFFTPHECKTRPVSCPNGCMCNEPMKPIREWEFHRYRACSLRLVQCPKCSQHIKGGMEALSNHQSKACPKAKTTCPNCNMQLKNNNELYHHDIIECPKKIIECRKHQFCFFSCTREEMKQHEQDDKYHLGLYQKIIQDALQQYNYMLCGSQLCLKVENAVVQIGKVIMHSHPIVLSRDQSGGQIDANMYADRIKNILSKSNYKTFVTKQDAAENENHEDSLSYLFQQGQDINI